MDLRNIAIIAHVDHGKTTLVDALLRQSKTTMDKSVATELIMDSNELERERGITIFSKNASVVYGDVKVNIIDTPGHADFGGEVERVLRMADGALLLIDAQEGPMPQTRFVLKKALQAGLRMIVVVNKIDKPNAKPELALERTYDLFIDLGANDQQIDFPVVYAAAKLGKAGLTPDLDAMQDITPVFETVLKTIPKPSGDPTKPFQMQVTSLAADSYKGTIAIGRVANGILPAAGSIIQLKREGGQATHKASALMTFLGLGRVEVQSIAAGDIVAIAGIEGVSIGDTIADPADPQALPAITIEKPTVKMTFSVNDSPFAGNEGTYSTSRQIRARLMKELETDVALRVEDAPNNDELIVSGRGELHLAILIERMRREGYELQVSRPEVIITTDEKGKQFEPLEEVFIEVPEPHSGIVIDKLGRRKAELKNMHVHEGQASLHYLIPTRALIGYRSEFLTDTRGTGILNTLFADLTEYKGEISSTPHGSLIAFEAGTSTSYGLQNAQERGQLFIGPGEEIYTGQVIGQNAKDEDLEVNVCKAKQLSNMRSKGDGVAEGLDTPHRLGLEDALEYISEDELVEVTPKNIRVRKKILDNNERRKLRR